MVTMLVLHLNRLSDTRQLLGSVLPDRLQHPVPDLSQHGLHLDEGFIHQAGQEVQHLPRLQGSETTDRLRRRQIPAPNEDRQARQKHLLRRCQEIVTPVDQRTQRLLARQRRPIPAPRRPGTAVRKKVPISSNEMERTQGAASSMASGMPSRR